MKKQFLLLVLILFCICLPVSFAGTVYDDGFITEGEYGYFVQWTNYDPPLIVDGGGADIIELRDYGRLEVQSTSMPLGLDEGGVYDILLDDHSSLTFYGGANELILIYDDATAILKGGQVNHIRNMQHVSGTGNITVECQPEWSWLYTSSQRTGITGLWANDDVFTITFFDDDTGYYDPTWENINIIEIPEPATLLLLGLGGLLLRRKK